MKLSACCLAVGKLAVFFFSALCFCVVAFGQAGVACVCATVQSEGDE